MDLPYLECVDIRFHVGTRRNGGRDGWDIKY